MYKRNLLIPFILLILCCIPFSSAVSLPNNTSISSTTTFADLDLGYLHSCAITTIGDLMCWGDNTDWSDYSALGVGYYPYNSPIPLFPLFPDLGTATIINVSAGDSRTCAITSSGDAYCWGDAGDGQLGNGSDDGSDTPVPVSGGINWAEISTGDYVSCGISTTGAAYCWGDNYYGSLGHVEEPPLSSSNTPVSVDTLGSGVRSISTGYEHACAVTTGDILYCWGYNNKGQVGNGSTDNVFSPVSILTDVADVSVGGSHTCALMTNGGVQCWGINSDCQLGDGTADPATCTGYTTSPAYVNTLGSGSGVTAIDGDFDHTCVLMTDHSMKCWGWNIDGQLGDGTTDDSAIPVTVDFGTDTRTVTAFSTGEYHTCSLMDDNNIVCWGDNDYGELGTGDDNQRLKPVDNVLTGRGYIDGRFNNNSSQSTGYVATAAYTSADLESTPVLVNPGYSNIYSNIDLFPLPGTYYILGFVDVNGNSAYDEGEAYAWYDDDGLGEPYAVEISEGEYIELSPTIYIEDPPVPLPEVSLSSATYSVGEAAGTLTVTANLNTASDSTVTVDYATSNGTASAGQDYTTANSTLTFNPSETSKTFNVTILSDAVYEGDETFNVTLSNPSGATLGDPISAVVTITDDESEPEVSFSSADYEVDENEGTLNIEVNLNLASATSVTVDYYTYDDTATAGSDYTNTGGTLTFTSLDTSETINVPIIEDSLFESNEYFNVSLTSPSGATLGSPSSTEVTIIDNDPIPEISLSSAILTVDETDPSVTITVEISGYFQRSIQVDYTTSNGSATAGEDYIATSGTLTFETIDVSKSFDVPISDDLIYEGDETFNVTLSNPIGAVFGTPSSAQVTITDDDTPSQEDFYIFLPLVLR